MPLRQMQEADLLTSVQRIQEAEPDARVTQRIESSENEMNAGKKDVIKFIREHKNKCFKGVY